MRWHRRRSRPATHLLWRRATGTERTALACVLALALVLGGLPVLVHGAWPLAVLGLLMGTAVLLWLRARVRRRLEHDRWLVAEAARGVRSLERWLASEPMA